MINNHPMLVEFLEFVFHRDPAYRPTILDMIQRFQYIRSKFMKNLAKGPSPRAAITQSEKEENSSEEKGEKSTESSQSLKPAPAKPKEQKKPVLMHSVSQKRLKFGGDEKRDNNT